MATVPGSTRPERFITTSRMTWVYPLNGLSDLMQYQLLVLRSFATSHSPSLTKSSPRTLMFLASGLWRYQKPLWEHMSQSSRQQHRLLLRLPVAPTASSCKSKLRRSARRAFLSPVVLHTSQSIMNAEVGVPRPLI